MPSEADSQAMIVRQREAFIKMHAKCEALERTNARLSNRVAVLERETVSLRVSATISVTILGHSRNEHKHKDILSISSHLPLYLNTPLTHAVW